ncbi:MAG: Mth938-like domain-containing protein [Candidatus Humimicrobiaceae bacterium]
MINSYSFGTITIDNQKYTKDFIIFPDQIISNWRRKTGHLLVEDDITEVLDYKPEVLIAGTGASGLMKVDNNLKDKLKALGIEFVIMKTAEAVTEYNRVYKDKRVIAALHLTC